MRSPAADPAPSGAKPRDAAEVMDLAREALARQTEAEVLPLVVKAAKREPGNARLWQWSALLYRGLDRQADAIAAFARAAQLSPGDAGIAHGLARSNLDAGMDSIALFERALRLAPGHADILLGLAAARLAAGHGDDAVAGLARVVATAPQWVQGHEQLSRLRWMMGDRRGFTASYHDALAARPGDEALWQSYVLALMRAGAHDAALAAIAESRGTLGDRIFLDANEAVVRSERGEREAPRELFDRLAGVDDPALAVHRVRHSLRTGDIEAALTLVERWALERKSPMMWPYAATAWRLSGDPRFDWLEGQDGLVGIYDLADRLPPLDELAAALRGLHRARDQHLDQSVRGGTQTDGVLFSRVDPIIQAVRKTIVEAVGDHIAKLPAPDPDHPTLGVRRDHPPRFSGSWSVRLRGGGHHANHVHPAGWFSSALYVALPDIGSGEGDQSGWLTLGAPQAEMGLDMPPVRAIEPRPGRLVLFPSTMWHGTVPFADGERLTIAFDVAHPPTRS